MKSRWMLVTEDQISKTDDSLIHQLRKSSFFFVLIPHKLINNALLITSTKKIVMIAHYWDLTINTLTNMENYIDEWLLH